MTFNSEMALNNGGWGAVEPPRPYGGRRCGVDGDVNRSVDASVTTSITVLQHGIFACTQWSPDIRASVFPETVDIKDWNAMRPDRN
jgi:hypothetical protein